MKRRSFLLHFLLLLAGTLRLRTRRAPPLLQLYQVTEADYVAAYSLQDAVEWYHRETGVDPHDEENWIDDDGPALVDGPTLDRLSFCPEDGGLSLREQLEQDRTCPPPTVPYVFVCFEV